MITKATQLIVDANAWCAEPGPILLLAGPGTGKTHQLALRIKFLVETKKISPEGIAVITFTREAAENMRRRISDEEKVDVFIPPELRPQRIMTMHGLGLEIIRANTGLLKLPNDFEVMTDIALRSNLFRDAALLAGFGETEAKEAADLRQKSEPLKANSPEEKIISTYQTILRSCHVIDYDDQISLACKLLTENTSVQEQYEVISQSCTHRARDVERRPLGG
jgi:DNA helicase-2/ATP-dependent DNA helicase PcrA